MSKRLAALVLTLGICSAHAPAQQARRELPSRLAPATRAAITSLADSLGSSGLPADVLYDKAAEGVLKGADDTRILVVVRGLARRLREAHALLGASARDDDLTAASTALYAGVPPAIIRRAAAVREEQPNAPSLSLTLTVLTALVSQQVPAEVAASSIDALVSRGAREFDLQAFQRSVELDIQGGGAPREATTSGMQRAIKTIDARRQPGE